MFTTVIGIIAGICTSISLLPQLIKILKEKKAEDISWGMLITLLTGLTLWVVYGFLKNEYPIVFTNLFAVMVNLLIIVFTLRYKNR